MSDFSIFFVKFILPPVILFAYFESIADVALDFAALDLYFLTRILVGIGFTFILIEYYSNRLSREFPMQKRQLATIGNYFELLKQNRIRYQYAWLHVLFWSVSVVLLSAAFAKASFILSAYIFFTFHPLWTFLFKNVVSTHKSHDVRIYACIFMMIVGTVVFLIGKEGLDLAKMVKDVPIFGLALFGGLAFAITNIAAGEAQLERNDSPQSVRMQDVYRNYLQLYKYAFGLVALLPVMAYVFTASNYSAVLSIKPSNQVLPEQVEKLKNIAEFYHIAFFEHFTVVKIFLVFSSLIASVANYWLFLAFCNVRRTPEISALELLSIPMAMIFAYMHGFFESPNNIYLFSLGLFSQLFFAGYAIYLMEKTAQHRVHLAEPYS